MRLEETCSCGATFAADGDSVLKLWREWRKAHVCSDKPPELGETLLTSSSAQIEQAPLGFAPTMLPGREDHALDE